MCGGRLTSTPPKPSPDDENLETKKLRLEVKKLDTPWWRDPEFWVKALSLPVSLIAIIATIYISSEQRTVRDLKSTIANLTAEKLKKETENATLETGNKSLRDQQRQLKVTNEQLKAKSQELRDKLEDEKFDTNLTLVLQAEGAGELYSGKMPYPLRHVIEIAQSSGARKQFLLSKLESALNTTSDIGVRTALIIALYEITHMAKWSDELVQELIASFKDTSPTPLALDTLFAAYSPPSLIRAELSAWSHRKKVGFCSTLYSQTDWRQHYATSTIGFVRAEFFSGHDPLEEMKPDDARFVTTYVSAAREIALNRNLPASDRIIAANFAAALSKEAAVTFLGTILADEQLSPVDRHRAFDFVSGPCGTSLEDLTGCPKSADAASWKQWIANNASTVEIFFQPLMPKLVEKFQNMLKTE